MGYKSFIRSVNASSNRAARAREREQNKQRRVQEKLDRNELNAKERLSKPRQKLDTLYASGKITSETYNSLLKRENDITIDLSVFGKSAGIELATRYITGKIDQDEFEMMKNHILGEPEAEKDVIVNDFEFRIEKAKQFIDVCQKSKDVTECAYCSKKKGILSPLFNVLNFKLCYGCRGKYHKTVNYPGYEGKYYNASPSKISANEKNELSITINAIHLYNYK